MTTQAPAGTRRLTAEDLLAGTAGLHDVAVPSRLLRPGLADAVDGAGTVRLRPLSVGTLVLISRAARDDPALVPLLMVKESLVEPAMSLEQLRGLNIGLVHFLVAAVNTVSGLSPSGDVLDETTAEAVDDALASPVGQVHVLLARHFGWSPQQVARLTPGQVAVYLAGVEALFHESGGATAGDPAAREGRAW